MSSTPEKQSAAEQEVKVVSANDPAPVPESAPLAANDHSESSDPTKKLENVEHTTNGEKDGFESTTSSFLDNVNSFCQPGEASAGHTPPGGEPYPEFDSTTSSYMLNINSYCAASTNVDPHNSSIQLENGIQASVLSSWKSLALNTQLVVLLSG